MDKTEIKIEFIKICRAWSALGGGTCKVCPFWGDGTIDSSPCNSTKSVYTQKNVETLNKAFAEYIKDKYKEQFK